MKYGIWESYEYRPGARTGKWADIFQPLGCWRAGGFASSREEAERWLKALEDLEQVLPTGMPVGAISRRWEIREISEAEIAEMAAQEAALYASPEPPGRYGGFIA